MPLKDWPLAWRFSELPQVAECTDVLSPQDDADLRAWIRDESPVATEFQGYEVMQFNLESCQEEVGLRFLNELPLGEEQAKCCVVWAGPFLSVRTELRFVLAYYYDFWYPGSDDLWVVPESSDWIMECDHHGNARFAPTTRP